MRKKIFEKPEIGAEVFVGNFTSCGVAFYQLRIAAIEESLWLDFYFINPIALHNFLESFNRKHTWQFWCTKRLPIYRRKNVEAFAKGLGERTRLLQYEFDVTHTNFIQK